MGGGAQSSGSPSSRHTYLARGLSEPGWLPWGIGVIAVGEAIDDSPLVPVHSVLRPSTFRAFAARARELGVDDVGTLLSLLADRSLRPKPEPAPHRRRRTAEEWARIDGRIAELNGQGLSDGGIAKVLKLSQPQVSSRRRGMGLESPSSQVPPSRAV